MKNCTTVRVNESRAFLYLFFMITMSFFLVSCQTEEMETPAENEAITGAALTGSADLHAAKKKGAPAPGDASIAAIAIAQEGEFEQLVAALQYVDQERQAGLVDLFLNGTDQYTVFAPTDAAFSRLYSSFEGVDEITDLPSELVLNVLLYHVTEGRRAANSVVPPRNHRTIETLLGESFEVNTQGQITAIGSTANIVTANISASNGIIHVIDEVLLPIE